MEISQLLGVILMVVTSHGELENGKPTGLWLEEFAVPYEAFTAAGYEVVVVSPRGGAAPIDPRSLPDTPDDREKNAIERLKQTRSLETLDLKTEPAAVFFAGGHGTMFDFPGETVWKWVKDALESDTPLGLVCHGPAALTGGEHAGGQGLLKGRNVTGFTNAEEDAVNLTDEMPFLLEDRLKALGMQFSSAPNFQPHVVVDGHLVTGQNPASSKGVAEALLKLLKK